VESVIKNARRAAAEAERLHVATEIRSLVERSGLSSQDFARHWNFSVSTLDLHVWEGHTLSGSDDPDAAGCRRALNRLGE
jgi:DNA-binding transcriptional regulator YiaG